MGSLIAQPADYLRVTVKVRSDVAGREKERGFLAGSSTTISCNVLTVGSSNVCSSPTSASHMNWRIALVSRRIVALKARWTFAGDGKFSLQRQASSP